MKVMIEKFISKIMDESYSRQNKGFSVKTIFEKHQIPYEKEDKVYLYSLNTDPISVDYVMFLCEFLKIWDQYRLNNPLKNTIIKHWNWHYKTKRRVKTDKSYIDRFGKKMYIFEDVIEKWSVEDVTVVDHINIYIQKKDGSVKTYLVYLTAPMFVTKHTDATKYIFHIKEVLQ